MRHSLYAFILLTLVACSSDPSAEDNKYTADELYNLGMTAMDDHLYEQAIKKFEKLQANYPYGRYAQQALMEIAYASYKQGEPAPAISAVDRFIKQYPNNIHLDYMYYLKGLINFDENLSGAMNSISNQDPSERDPKSVHESFDTFKELLTRFPDSEYSPDARLRMQYLINTLAASDIHVASYYLRRGAYVAAVSRAKSVLINYPQAPQTREALQVMVLAYDAMGMIDLRDDAKRVLSKNAEKDGSSPAPLIMTKRNTAWWRFWE
jgi:outer membrane protein assembly factor BamD